MVPKIRINIPQVASYKNKLLVTTRIPKIPVLDKIPESKAVAGAVLLGGVGLLAGGIGANKTVVTCMNCGYKFKF